MGSTFAQRADAVAERQRLRRFRRQGRAVVFIPVLRQARVDLDSSLGMRSSKYSEHRVGRGAAPPVGVRTSTVSRVPCPCGKYDRVPTRQRAPLRFREASATRGRRQDGMTQAVQHRVFVDGNNVMGSRPDGWWRDRAEAARRLIADIPPLALDQGGVWTIVFDGQVPSGMAPAQECLTVLHTGHGRRDGADDRIVQLVDALPERSTSRVYSHQGVSAL